MRNSSTNFFYEEDYETPPSITDDHHSIWPVTLRIGQVSIFMTRVQIVEFMNYLNASLEEYMRGPNYGK